MFSEADKHQSEQSGSTGRFYFDEPRLRMTLVGRLTVRIASYIGYLVILAAGFTLIFSDVQRLRAAGIFLFLFFADRLLHLREADKPFSELPNSGRVNLSHYLSPASYSILEKAFDRSSLAKRNFFLEIIAELLSRREIEESLSRLDVAPEEFKQKVEDFLAHSTELRANLLESEPRSRRPEQDVEGLTSSRNGKTQFGKAALLQQVEILVIEAGRRSLLQGRRFIEPIDLFSGLFFVGDETVNRLFNVFSIVMSDLELALLLSSLKGPFRFRLPSTLGGFRFEVQRRLRHRIMNRAWTSRPTGMLDRFSVDLTDLARAGESGFLIGHEEEYQRLTDTLSRPINPNVLFVGEEGIGKETIVKHLAARIARDEVPAQLFDKRLVCLEINSLVAGAPPEELQQRLKQVVEEIFMAGNVILYIPDMHNLMKTSGNYLSAADALMPIIKNNVFPVVGATYPREFKEFIEPRSDVTGIFEIIRVNEISEVDAQKILVYESVLLERKAGVIISFGAIKEAVMIAKKYFPGKYLPASAEELLKDAVAMAARKEKKYVRHDEVVTAAENKINIPIHEAGAAEAEALLHMEEIIHRQLIDQEEAVRSVSTALREYRSGLSRRGGPIASFLFVGPTGVGKTELAKILARLQFGSEQLMIRFDMTEYQDKQSFYRFIGSPDGSTRGALTEAVLQKPYSLILLDEFEKAFPDILNLFLQVLDEGRLTDNLGRTVGFQNTIIIATSNAHSDIINQALSHGEKMTDVADYLKKRLVDVFKPELLNRFSKVVVFKDLSPADVEHIARYNLNDLSNNLGEQGIKLGFDESAIKQIAKLGYEPAFGARPLRRAIEEQLRAPLAEKILAREITRGSRLQVSFENEAFQFAPVKE